MLEIFVIISLCKKMGELMRGRGYEKPFWFQFFVPVFWFAGEFTSGLIYGVERALKGQPTDGLDLKVYLVALAGAILASTLYFVIAKSIPPRSSADSQLGQ